MNHPSPRKRHWPAITLIALAVGALSACLLVAGYLYLPMLVTERLPLTRIKRLGFSDFSGRISKIGLRRTMAGPFVFGPADQPALAIDSVELDYTVGELRRKKIRRIRIDDVIVNGTLGSNGFALPGFNPQQLANRPPVDASPASMDIAVEMIEVRGGMLFLSWRNVVYEIPFEADLRPDGEAKTSLAGQVRLIPRGQRLVLNLQIDMENREVTVNLDGPFIALNRFTDLIHLIPGLDATGIVTVQADSVLTLEPFGVADTSLNLTWAGGRLVYGKTVIEPGPDAAQGAVCAVSQNPGSWQITAHGVQVQKPAPVAINRFTATVDLAGEIREVAGSGELTVMPILVERPRPLSLNNSVSIPFRIAARQTITGQWSAEISSADKKNSPNPEPLALSAAGVDVQTDLPRFSVAARGAGRRGTARWNLDFATIRATTAGGVVELPSAGAAGELDVKPEPHGHDWSGDIRLRLPRVTMDGSDMDGRLETLSLSAQFEQQGEQTPVVDARLRFSNGQFEHKASGLHLSGGRMDLPFASRPGRKGRPGTFSIARVVHNRRLVGKIEGRIAQTKQAYKVSAFHSSDLLPGMTASFSGTVHTEKSRFAEAYFTWQMPPYDLPAESKLVRFIPAVQGVTLSGTLSASGEASVSPKGMQGSLDVGLAGGALTMAQKQIALEGIDMRLRFPDLPRIRSAPAQSIRFDRAAMGSIVVDGGSVDVQVASKKTLFVEKGRLNWCGGKVDVQSLRVTAGRQDYEVSLYCQRLGLSRILEQLGSVNARGTGTLNGRIPIVYRNGNIRFDDGFLFSTPGEAGQIQLSGMEVLTRGIPAGTPQFAQVDLAREALKDYAYSWAKLGLSSEGETFVMRLQFEGKPVNPLPFVYKKKLGSFVRVEAGAQGSVFEGIGLDVNLRLPLNQLLQYKDIVDMIQ